MTEYPFIEKINRRPPCHKTYGGEGILFDFLYNIFVRIC